MDYIIKKAVLNDIQGLISILKETNLPFNDIDLNNQQFLLAYLGKDIIASCAVEQYKKEALLKSFAVKMDLQGKGIGKEIYLKMIDYCKSNEIEDLYLLTTTAEDWFDHMGWIRVKRESLPESIKNTKEYNSICPLNAICMYLSIADSPVKNTISKFKEHFNCAQSVFSSYAPKFGINESDALKIASGFVAGINYKGKTCGAVTGAYMTIGLKYGFCNAMDKHAREIISQKLYEFDREFIKRNGSIECHELLKGDVSDKDQLEKLRKEGVFRRICPEFIKDSAEILKDI